MEQAESNPDSLRVFTRERWFVQLGMGARGIACCSKCGTSGKIVMQMSAFKLPACSRVTLALDRKQPLAAAALPSQTSPASTHQLTKFKKSPIQHFHFEVSMEWPYDPFRANATSVF